MRRIFVAALALVATAGYAQQGSYFDPAQAYNRLLIEKNGGTYTQVGNFKVTGTSYLFGSKNNGDIYGPTETGKDVSLAYNSYNQQVEFFPAGSNSSLVKEPGTLDSFVIHKNRDVNLETDIVFHYASQLGGKDKNYYQLVHRGKKASLYKRYTAELGVVSTNYIQAELRQFNILVDYFWVDSTGKNLKKLKMNAKSLEKELGSIKSISSVIDPAGLTAEREKELVKIFEAVNAE